MPWLVLPAPHIPTPGALRRKARDLGHVLGPWEQPRHASSPVTHHAVCLHCDAPVSRQYDGARGSGLTVRCPKAD